MAGNTLIGLLSYENDVFTTYAFWSSVLIIKMLLMSILTGMQRFRTNVSNISDNMSQTLYI